MASAGCGFAPSPPARNTRKPGLDRAVVERAVDGDHADVVEHRLAAVGAAAGEVDLELARQSLAERVAQQMTERGLGPLGDVEHLVRAGAGEVAALHVADHVAARLASGHPDRAEHAQHVGNVGQLDEVELDRLAGGDVAPAARVADRRCRPASRAARAWI